MKTIFLALALMFMASAARADFTEFSLPVMSAGGGNYDSAQFHGALVLDFFFDSCPACNSNAPNVHEIASEFHSAMINVVEVGVDCDDSDYDHWMRNHPPAGIVINSCRGDIQDRMGIHGYPTTVVLDCHRAEIMRIVGVWSAQKKRDLRALLEEQIFRTCD